MAQWLSIILPGRNYGPTGAVLRLPALVMENEGAQSAVVEYSTSVHPSIEELASDVSRQVTTLIAAERPQRVTFVAKSLGTAVLALLEAVCLERIRVEALWLTPLFNDASVRAGAIQHHWRSMLVAGDVDNSHDPVGFEEVRHGLDAESLLVRGANHSLEIPSNPAATVAVLRDLVNAVQQFAAQP